VPLRVLTRWELHAFVDAAEGDPCRALIQFLAFTVHLGEALALRWQDIDLERGSARIWRSLRLNRERPPRFGRRSVDLPTRLVRTLDQLDFSDELVFPDLFREFVRARRVRRAFRRISRRAGLSRVNPYVLRHTWANGMLNAGVPLSYVSRALGHETTALTARFYRRPLPERR
jgi:integrase